MEPARRDDSYGVTHIKTAKVALSALEVSTSLETKLSAIISVRSKLADRTSLQPAGGRFNEAAVNGIR